MRSRAVGASRKRANSADHANVSKRTKPDVDNADVNGESRASGTTRRSRRKRDTSVDARDPSRSRSSKSKKERQRHRKEMIQLLQNLARQDQNLGKSDSYSLCRRQWRQLTMRARPVKRSLIRSILILSSVLSTRSRCACMRPG